MHPLTRERVETAILAVLVCFFTIVGLFSLFIKAGCP